MCVSNSAHTVYENVVEVCFNAETCRNENKYFEILNILHLQSELNDVIIFWH